VLILTTAALAEVRAKRRDPIGGGDRHAAKPGPRKALLYFSDFRLHDVAHRHEWDENNKILYPRHPSPRRQGR